MTAAFRSFQLTIIVEKKIRVLPVAHPLIQAVLPIAVVVRRLHESDLHVVEESDEGRQKVGPDVVIAVDQTDQCRIRSCMAQREIQRPRFCARAGLQMKEAKTRVAETPALHRLPKVRVLRVVINDEHFKIGIFEPRERVQRLDDDVCRFGADRHVEGHLRVEPSCNNRQRSQRASPLQTAHSFELFENLSRGQSGEHQWESSQHQHTCRGADRERSDIRDGPRDAADPQL